MTLLECFDKHGCDKGSARHRYDKFYEPIFEPIRNEPIRLLEIGIFRGASIAAWLDYFPNAQIIGVDTFERVPPEQIPVLKNSRVSYLNYDSRHRAPRIEPVDFVIDDGSHDPSAQSATAYLYRPLVKYGGKYFIEDIKARPVGMEMQAKAIYEGAAGEWLAIL
jgi:hypothetical protein